MNYYYVTGTSRGIGYEIVNQLLENGKNKVIGISRTQTINHPNYTHFKIDLSDLKSVCDFKFESHPDAEKIILINNAGVLGMVMPVGGLNNQIIINTYNINVIAPSILINSFIKNYNASDAQKVILNISSGAGKYPYDGWSVYCASKAAIDMFARVVEEEHKLNPKLKNTARNNFRIIAVAPGKVDTAMQEQLRKLNPEEFSKVAAFIDFKEKGELIPPYLAAKKFIEITENISNYPETLFSIKY